MAPPRTPPGVAPHRNGSRRAVPQFVLAGVVALVVLSVATVLVSRRVGTDEAMRDARALTRTIGADAVEPALQPGIEHSDPAAVAALDRVVRGHVIGDPVARVKLWSPDGTIVYSDDASLIGQRFSSPAGEQTALRTGEVHSEVSDLTKPENLSERGLGRLLEVYLPVRSPSGGRLLFEAYLRYTTVTSGARRIWVVFIPMIVGVLFLLEAVQVPLAWRMTRRIRRDQEERERLMRKAVEASDAERRRIAADLHDGVVQDLAGMAFTLSGIADGLDHDGQRDRAGRLRAAALTTRRSIRSLRSLLVEIYPPNLAQTGLAAALSDLGASLAGRGVAVEVEVEEVPLPAEVEALVFRTAQEALRNVVAHAEATSARVSVASSGGSATLTVVDDGRGFDPTAPRPPRAPGHLGLQLLSDLAGAAGGRLEVDSGPGRGTRLRLEVPVR